jgi:hypothetical protein
MQFAEDYYQASLNRLQPNDNRNKVHGVDINKKAPQHYAGGLF